MSNDFAGTFVLIVVYDVARRRVDRIARANAFGVMFRARYLS